MNVFIYGASGQLGRGVAAELRRRGIRLLLAARNLAKLEAVAQADDVLFRLPQKLPPGAKVVFNCAPLSLEQTGRLIREALEGGAHYVDATSDQFTIDRILRDFSDAPGCVIPALGFDYAVGDCLARLSAAEAEQVDEVVIAYALAGKQAAQASLDFATQKLRGPEVVFRRGAWQPVPFELDFATFAFPPPVGRRQMARYGAGEVVTVPRHTRTRRVQTLITADSLVPHRALLPVFPVLRPVMGRLLRWAWVRSLLRRFAGVSKAPTASSCEPGPLPPGPSFTVVVESYRHGRRWARCGARGADCYKTTAESLALGIELLLQGRHSGRGARSVAATFAPEVFLERLEPGLNWWAE